jgi:hypothetical protein
MPVIDPAVSAVNFTPNSTAAVSFTVTVAGVAVAGHKLHGQVAAAAGIVGASPINSTINPINAADRPAAALIFALIIITLPVRYLQAHRTLTYICWKEDKFYGMQSVSVMQLLALYIPPLLLSLS